MSDLLDLCAPNATWHSGACAEVRVGEHVTRYVRRGSGPSVVLAGVNTGASSLWSALVTQLGPSFRLIVPQPAPSTSDLITWLRGFMEGLGLTSVVLFAGEEVIPAAMELAAEDDFTVTRLVLIPTGGSSVPAVPPADDDRVLAVNPAWPIAEAVGRVSSFLGHGNGNASAAG